MKITQANRFFELAVSGDLANGKEDRLIAVSEADKFWCKHQCDSSYKHQGWVGNQIRVDNQAKT